MIQRGQWAISLSVTTGRTPTNQNTIAPANTIATMLVRNNNVDPAAKAMSPIANANPEVAKGGTNAAAIATPGIADIKFGRPNAYAAAIPLTNATIRSINPGMLRLAISLVASASATNKNAINPVISPIKNAVANPIVTVFTEDRISF